jgi:hypothetical protein
LSRKSAKKIGGGNMGDLFCDDEETFSYSRLIGLVFLLRHLYDLTGRSEFKASEILDLIDKVNKEWGDYLIPYSLYCPFNPLEVLEKELKKLKAFGLIKTTKYISRNKDTDILITLLDVDNLREFYNREYWEYVPKYISNYSSDIRKTLEHVLRKEGKLK